MIEVIEAFPLTWPVGQLRTWRKHRRYARFELEFGRARDELLRSLKLLGTHDVVISSNIPLRRDGLPLASASEPLDPGVAVYFSRRMYDAQGHLGDMRPFVIACDTYTKVKWNLRAVGLVIEAYRDISRHGATSLLEQAFSGFAALPPASAGARPYWEVLGIAMDATGDALRRRYNELAMEHHPDRGGSHEKMAEINAAYDEAMHRSGYRR